VTIYLSVVIFQNIIRDLTEEEVQDFFNGASISVATQRFKYGESKGDAAQNAIRMPYNDVYEINEEYISLGKSILRKILNVLQKRLMVQIQAT